MGVYIEYDKPFLTYDEQIAHLENKYNLKIDDKGFARSILSTISYYDLINGYQEYTLTNGKFKDGITLKYLSYFYLFDKSMQNLFLKNSLLVENIFKTKLAYALAKNYGVDVYDYLNKKHFKYSHRNNIYFKNVKDEIFRRIDKFKPMPTQHYLNNHNHIPPWILLRNVEFGNAINLYRLLKEPVKYEVAESLIKGTVSSKEKFDFTESALNFIKFYRNKVAHNLKIKDNSYNPKLPYTTTIKIVNNKDITSGYTSFNDLYSYILSINLLLDEKLLRAKFSYDFTSIILDRTKNNEQTPLQKKLVFDYISINKLPLDLIERLNLILNW